MTELYRGYEISQHDNYLFISQDRWAWVIYIGQSELNIIWATPEKAIKATKTIGELCNDYLNTSMFPFGEDDDE